MTSERILMLELIVTVRGWKIRGVEKENRCERWTGYIEEV